MNDVPEFIHKAEDIYGYHHFINDAGGSVCELDSPEVLETLAQNTLIIYIKIPPALEQTIIERAKTDPKPLYYREAFLDDKLAEFMQTEKLCLYRCDAAGRVCFLGFPGIIQIQTASLSGHRRPVRLYH